MTANIDYGQGSLAPMILKASVPIIFAELVSLLYSMVDRMYIGHIADVGSLSLTGLGLCFPIISFLIAFSRLYGSNGGSPLFAIARGRKDHREAEDILSASVLLSLYTSVVLVAVIGVFMHPLLFLFGASRNTYPYARDYLMIYLLGTPFSLIGLTLSSFVNAEGRSDYVMKGTLLGALINIILDPIFIFIFSWGIKGAAIATVSSQAVTFFFFLFLFQGGRLGHVIRFDHRLVNRKRVMPILSLGTSGFVMGATNSLTQVVTNKVAYIYGGDMFVGVMAILNSIREVMSTPVMGIGTASGPVISYNYGAGRMDRVRRASLIMLSYCLVIGLLTWGIVFFLARPIVSLFTSDLEVIEIAVPSLRIYFFAFFFMAFQTSGQQSFVSLKKAGYAIFFSLFRKVMIVVPLSLVLPRFLSVEGLLIAEPISNVIGGLASYITMYVTTFMYLK